MIDWNAIASKVDVGGFSPTPQLPDYEAVEHWDDSPCPDFADRLPDEILNKDGNPVYLSQSFMQNFRKVIDSQLCPYRFHAVSVSREYRDESGDAAKMGSRFEFELTGAPDYHGNEPPEILTATGQVGVDQKRISYNAQLAKATLARLGIDLSKSTISRRINFKCLSGEMDIETEIEGTEYICDVKYSGTIGQNPKYNDYAWDKSELTFGQRVQSNHYPLLRWLETGKWPEFMYLVFDNRAKHEGEYLPIRVKLSDRAKNMHMNFVLKMAEELQRWIAGEKFRAVPSYDGCKGCPVQKDCKHFQAFPEVVEIEL